MPPKKPEPEPQTHRETSELDTRIGQRIRARRLEIGMSQEALAATLGITFQQVQKYEKGVNRTSSSRLYDIARALKCSVLLFFDDAAAKGDIESDGAGLLAQPHVFEIATAVAAMTPKTRKRVLDLLTVMT